MDDRVANAFGKLLMAQRKSIWSAKRALYGEQFAILFLETKEEEERKHKIEDGNVVECDLHNEILGTCTAHMLDKEVDGARPMEATLARLAQVEREALDLIHQTVAENPPKALMAIITPDPSSARGGTLMGGWSGERDAFRSDEFKRSGGAPCPKEFTVRENNR